jgi:hypothetical protein
MFAEGDTSVRKSVAAEAGAAKTLMIPTAAEGTKAHLHDIVAPYWNSHKPLKYYFKLCGLKDEFARFSKNNCRPEWFSDEALGLWGRGNDYSGGWPGPQNRVTGLPDPEGPSFRSR